MKMHVTLRSLLVRGAGTSCLSLLVVLAAGCAARPSGSNVATVRTLATNMPQKVDYYAFGVVDGKVTSGYPGVWSFERGTHSVEIWAMVGRGWNAGVLKQYKANLDIPSPGNYILHLDHNEQATTVTGFRLERVDD